MNIIIGNVKWSPLVRLRRGNERGDEEKNKSIDRIEMVVKRRKAVLQLYRDFVVIVRK